MADEVRTEWRPDWAVPPGEVLLEALQERGISQADLARRMGRPVKTINEIVKAKASITPETAIQLELVLGISAKFWTNLEGLYRQRLAEEESRERLATHLGWLRRFPVRELRQQGIVPPSRAPESDQVAALLRFFGVASVEAWERYWSNVAVAFRGSSNAARSLESVSAWLRWGEAEAATIDAGRFHAGAFREVLEAIRPLTRRQPPYSAIEEARQRCAEVGVVVVLTPEFPKAPLSGAARWLSTDLALVQLSLRYKRDDQFWFTLYHEAGHLLAPGPRSDVVDDLQGDDDPEERWANHFARTCLVPEGDYQALVASRDFSRQHIKDFAVKVGVAPGIVVGMLQHDGYLEKSHLNDLKKPIEWTAGSG